MTRFLFFSFFLENFSAVSSASYLTQKRTHRVHKKHRFNLFLLSKSLRWFKCDPDKVLQPLVRMFPVSSSVSFLSDLDFPSDDVCCSSSCAVLSLFWA